MRQFQRRVDFGRRDYLESALKAAKSQVMLANKAGLGDRVRAQVILERRNRREHAVREPPLARSDV